MSTTLKKNKVCAVIPFYNESKSLGRVIEKTLPLVDKIILVDDGSRDGSRCVIPRNDKIILKTHADNLGKGAALKTGLTESVKLNFDISITLDADLQHPPELIPEFISAVENYHIAVGNRLGNLGKMPLQRIASNKLTSYLLSKKTGTKLIDTQCGYRSFRTVSLPGILPDYTGYEAESEMLIKAARNKLSVGFITIPTIYGEEKSKLKPLKTIIGFLRILFI